MDCIYINLPAQEQRRLDLVRNFESCANDGWRLVRLEATDAASVTAAGTLSPREKACVLSHRRAIDLSRQSAGPALIVEDDALFSPTSFKDIEAGVAGLQGVAWDILYPEVGVAYLPAMVQLYLQWREISAAGRRQLLDLKGTPFFSATAYVVNPGSRDKLGRLVDQAVPSHIPYDLLLNKLVQDGQLRGFVTIPFLTSISHHADASQIQPAHARSASAALNGFRKLLWAGRSLDEVAAALAKAPPVHEDGEAAAFVQICRIVLSEDLKKTPSTDAARL